MIIRRAYFLLLVLPLWMMGAAQAQMSHNEFGAGAAFSSPQAQMGNNVDTGWNFTLRGGPPPASPAHL